MKKNIATTLFMFAALALFTVPADAAKQVNDVTNIDLAVFVPCADGGAGELGRSERPVAHHDPFYDQR